jgi:hypothetical protein
LTLIALEGGSLDNGEGFFSLGAKSSSTYWRIASMIHFPEGDYCSWRWEIPMAYAQELLGQCFRTPDEEICKMADGEILTGFQLRNLIFNCRIVYQ